MLLEVSEELVSVVLLTLVLVTVMLVSDVPLIGVVLDVVPVLV